MLMSFGQFRQEVMAGDKDIAELKNYAKSYNRNCGGGEVLSLDIGMFGREAGDRDREGESGNVER